MFIFNGEAFLEQENLFSPEMFCCFLGVESKSIRCCGLAKIAKQL